MEISIYFGGELTNLYDIGWISTDLNQIVEFSELIEQHDREKAEKFFGEKAHPFNRFATLIEKRERKPEIIDVKRGSLELVLGGVTLAATIVMPLVQIAVQKQLNENGETVTFQVSPQDPELKRVMDNYANGAYGRGTQGLENLFGLLQRMNYDVAVLAENVYLVEHVIKKYSQRVIRTIKKNRQQGVSN